MKLVLVRHCETAWNAAGKMQGQTDTPLNDTGRQQALDLCDQLEPLGISEIFSSDLQRATQTGYIISLRLGVPVKTDPRLRECSFGRLEGMTQAEAFQQYPHPHLYPIHAKFYTSEKQPYDFSAYGGESKAAVLKRHMDFLSDLKKNYAGKTVLAIGHGTGLNTLLSALGQEPDMKRGELRFVDLS